MKTLLARMCARLTSRPLTETDLLPNSRSAAMRELLRRVEAKQERQERHAGADTSGAFEMWVEEGKVRKQ